MAKSREILQHEEEFIENLSEFNLLLLAVSEQGDVNRMQQGDFAPGESITTLHEVEITVLALNKEFDRRSL